MLLLHPGAQGWAVGVRSVGVTRVASGRTGRDGTGRDGTGRVVQGMEGMKGIQSKEQQHEENPLQFWHFFFFSSSSRPSLFCMNTVIHVSNFIYTL